MKKNRFYFFKVKFIQLYVTSSDGKKGEDFFCYLIANSENFSQFFPIFLFILGLWNHHILVQINFTPFNITLNFQFKNR